MKDDIAVHSLPHYNPLHVQMPDHLEIDTKSRVDLLDYHIGSALADDELRSSQHLKKLIVQELVGSTC